MTENITKQLKKSPRVVGSRDEKYMALAFSIANIFSKDPDTQVGAVIIDKNGRPQGWGYNGPPSCFNDDDIDWARPQKHSKIIHSEINAIQHSKGSLYSSTLYVTAPPCERCFLEIIGAGIKRIVYHKLYPKRGSSINDESLEKIRILAEMGQIELIEMELIDIFICTKENNEFPINFDLKPINSHMSKEQFDDMCNVTTPTE
jgi:deoxycytidylate deaminase